MQHVLNQFLKEQQIRDSVDQLYIDTRPAFEGRVVRVVEQDPFRVQLRNESHFNPALVGRKVWLTRGAFNRYFRLVDNVPV